MTRMADVFGMVFERTANLAAQARRLAHVTQLERWSGLRGGAHDIDPSVDFRTRQQIRLASPVVLRAHVLLNGRSETREYGIDFGPDTYMKERCIADAYGGHIAIAGPAGIAQGAFLHGGGGIDIGAYVIMGPNCSVIASNHAFGSPGLPIMLQGDRRRGISIGNNVWLGAGVTILDGVRIGNNVVIGAGATVMNDVADDTVLRPVLNYTTEPLRYST